MATAHGMWSRGRSCGWEIREESSHLTERPSYKAHGNSPYPLKSAPISAYVDPSLGWNVSITPSSLALPCNARHLPPRGLSYPLYPMLNSFFLAFYCIHSAPHIWALYGFLNHFLSPAKQHVPLGQGSAKGVSHQSLQTQLKTQRKNSGGCSSAPKKDAESSSDHIQTSSCHISTLESNRVIKNKGYQLRIIYYVSATRLRIILYYSLNSTMWLLLKLSLF